MKNKISFISNLLASKKIDSSQKERILLLTKKELDSIGNSNELINIKIAALEKKMNTIQSPSANSISENIMNELGEEYNDFQVIINQVIEADETMIHQHTDVENEMIVTTMEQKETFDSLLLDMSKQADEAIIQKHIDTKEIIFRGAIEQQEETNLKLLDIYMSPKDLKDFLIEYNQNDVLKYTCHLIDGDALLNINFFTKTPDYNFDKHLKLIKLEFFNLSEKYKTKINKNILALFGEYLNNYIKEEDKQKKGWSSDNVKITWSSPELIKWVNLNPGKCPNPDSTLNSTPFNFQPFRINNQQTRVQNFNDIVLHFKSLFHIRRDNSLRAAIDLVNNNYFLNIVEIDCSDIRENIEFFTDIDKVKQAYKKIIEMCIEFQKDIDSTIKPVFGLSLIEDNDSIIFSIHHKNSIFGKTSKNTISREGEKTKKLINLINGVCDMYLKADFGNDDYAQINLWNGLKKETKKLESFKGVQFNLIFYR
jgi:hypothetical protein